MNSNLQAILEKDKSDIEKAIYISELDSVKRLLERLKIYNEAVERLALLSKNAAAIIRNTHEDEELASLIESKIESVTALLSGKEGE